MKSETESEIANIDPITRLLQGRKLYLFLITVFVVHSFGLYWCTCVAVCFLFFILGCFLRLFFHIWTVRCPLLLQEFEELNFYTEEQYLLPQLNPTIPDRNCKFSCSEELQKLINEILDLTVRDFVLSWYANLTNDEAFAKSIRIMLSRATKLLILNLKKVNWVTLLTHDFIDDFATHLRLFRKAKQKYQKTVPPDVQTASSDLLEQYFFEMEHELEKKFSRKTLAKSKSGESEYLRSLADILNYFVIPPKDLTPKIFRLVLRDVAKRVLEASIDLLCDPDYICSTVAYQLSTVSLKYEDFTLILETTDDPDELNSIMECLQQEIQLQRSKDTGGAGDESIKQQLGSLYYLEKLLNRRLSHMQTSNSEEGGFPWESCVSMYDLSLAFVLCNHVALCSFIDYLSETDGKSYIDMYLTIEGFKNSFVRIPLSKSTTNARPVDPLDISSAREVAMEIYSQHFESNNVKLVDIDEGIKKRLQAMIKSKVNHPSVWFDELQQRAFEILENDVRFYPSFKRSYAYAKLLAELKLLTLHDNMVVKRVDESGPFFVTGDNEQLDRDSEADSTFTYETSIKTIGMGNDDSNMFAVYNIEVKRFNAVGECVKHWVVTRRYSDFYNLNSLVKRKFPQLAKISFPAKKTFNNMHQGFLESRKRSLNTYLRTLLDPALLKRSAGLEDLLKDFLYQTNYTGDSGSFANKLTSVVDPIRCGVKFVGNAVISMPDTLLDGVCRVGDGLGKVTRTVFRIQEPITEEEQCGRVAASLNYESADSIPLRILMLLMDEIFGLREKNQWIRRRMVSFLQQLIHATYGSSLNRKIIQYVYWLTSEERLTTYLKNFRNSIWSGNVFAPPVCSKTKNSKARTRVVARTQVLSLLPDEFKLFIGNETCRAGVSMLFEALQFEALNRRLCHVLLERLIVSTFPGRNLEQVISFLLQKETKKLSSKANGMA